MRKLNVSIEINGSQTLVGRIVGERFADAQFIYSQEYMNRSGSVPISISLPFQKESFSPVQTRNFFDGLLPEGFTRKSVAQWVHAETEDYLSILAVLGRECLGAIQIVEDGKEEIAPSYERLSVDQVRELAREGTLKSAEIVTKTHLSLTGASGKVGLYYHETQGEWFLPIGDAPSTHIVKQSHVRLRDIITNEQLSLMTAAKLGLDVPHSFIVNVGEKRDEDVLFATKRYDRRMISETCRIDALPVPLRLHQEDFAQALGIASFDKYEKAGGNYLREMFDLLRRVSSNPIEDQLKLWDMIIFHFLIGNTDNHIKNFSLLYGADLKSVRLAPAYDIVSTAVYDSSTRNMAFRIGRENCLDRISRNDFLDASDEIGLGQRMAMRHFDDMCNCFEHALSDATNILMDMGFERAKDIQMGILGRGGCAILP